MSLNKLFSGLSSSFNSLSSFFNYFFNSFSSFFSSLNYFFYYWFFNYNFFFLRLVLARYSKHSNSCYESQYRYFLHFFNLFKVNDIIKL